MGRPRINNADEQNTDNAQQQEVSQQNETMLDNEQQSSTEQNTDNAQQQEETSNNKTRIKCVRLAGESIVIGSEIVNIDETGILYVDSTEADAILKLNGFEKA